MLKERFTYSSLLLFSLALFGCGSSEPVRDAGEATQTPQLSTTDLDTEMTAPDLDFDSGERANPPVDSTTDNPPTESAVENFTVSDVFEDSQLDLLTTKPQPVLKRTKRSVFKLVSAPSVADTSTTDDTNPSSDSDTSDSDLDFTDEDLEFDSKPKVPADRNNSATPSDKTGESFQHLTVVDKYPNNKLRLSWRIKRYKDGQLVFHGPYQEFYENGTKFSEGTYVEGKLDGEWTFWHKNGQLAKKTRYLSGKPEGTSQIYRADGTLSVQENYREGKPEGRWKHYLSDGKQVLRQEEYLQGKRHGQWTTWFEPKGDTTEELQKESITNWQSGRRHGEQFLWFENGQSAKEEHYFEDKPHGLFKVWRENGSLAGEQQYVHGVPGSKG